MSKPSWAMRRVLLSAAAKKRGGIILLSCIVFLVLLLSTQVSWNGSDGNVKQRQSNNNGDTRTSEVPETGRKPEPEPELEPVIIPPFTKPLPMCDHEGNCGEDPSSPSTRTEYSSHSEEQYNKWWTCHAALNKSAAEFSDNSTRRDRATPLILLGDSITEAWLGTGMGDFRKRAVGVPSVLHDLAATVEMDPLVLAIGGDQTQHLLWRMQHGEVLFSGSSFSRDPKAIFVVLIGTNNLGSGFLPGPTAKGILSVAEYILKNASGRLLLLELLPRGDGSQVLKRLCPPRCDTQGKPYKAFMSAVEKANAAVGDAVPALSKKYHGRLDLVKCGSAFLGKNPVAEVDTSLMPDRLHPNAKGHKILAKCISDCIKGSC